MSFYASSMSGFWLNIGVRNKSIIKRREWLHNELI